MGDITTSDQPSQEKKPEFRRQFLLHSHRQILRHGFCTIGAPEAYDYHDPRLGRNRFSDARRPIKTDGIPTMHRFRHALWTVTPVVAALALCLHGCDWGSEVEPDEGLIDSIPISTEDKTAEKPVVEFHCLTADSSLNQFVHKALTACAEGDYDQFRQLFATSHRPPEQEDFKRIWYGVQGVLIQSIHGPYQGQDGQPTYFVHALIRLRKPDSKDRQKRDAVVAVFQEDGEWRLGAAPPGVAQKILAASTQPASRPASRPAT